MAAGQVPSMGRAGLTHQNDGQPEEPSVGAWREAPAAGSTPNAQRPTSNEQVLGIGFNPWALDVGSRALGVECLADPSLVILMRQP